MKILFVLECANRPTNGTTATCIRFAKELEKKGHEVTIIGCTQTEEDRYHRYVSLPKYHFPLFDWLIVKEGFNFVRLDDKAIYDAVRGQDVVHLFLPFKLQNRVRLIAQELGVAVTAAFHILPQNITSAIHMGKIGLINNVMFYVFRKYIYDYVHYVHCPSQMTADELKRHHYKRNECRVISNGVIPFFKRMEVERPKVYHGKYLLCMSGRLADEKRQDLIIKAVAKSKYNDQIQIILCGQGPNKKKYLRLAKKRKLANPLQIKFCTAEELRDILSYVNLYVHASDFEIEGISAIEAITCGAVPLISNHRLCATKDFSLDDEHCLFKHGSVKDLTKKIDWFIEHPDERKALREAYLKDSVKYSLSYQVDELEKMFIDAYNEKKEGKDLPTTHPRKKDKFYLKLIHRRLKKASSRDEA